MNILFYILFWIPIHVFGIPEDTLLSCLSPKKAISLIYLWFLRRKHRNRFNDHDFLSRDPVKAGAVASKQEWEAELPGKDFVSGKCSEGIFLYGLRSDGELLLARINRYSRQIAHASLYLRLADGRTFTIPDEVSLDLSDGNKFHTRGLRLQCLRPMRKWRIVYRGLMVQCGDKSADAKKDVYVRLNFIWTAMTNVFDWTKDIPASSVAQYLSSGSWLNILENAERYTNDLDGYEQGGHLMGTVHIEEEETEMYLYGIRMRCKTQRHLEPNPSVSHVFGYTKRGQIFHLLSVNTTESKPGIFTGHYITPAGFSDAIVTCSTDGQPPSCTRLSSAKRLQFTTDKKMEFEISLENVKTLAEWNPCMEWVADTKLECFEFNFKNVPGNGLRITSKPVILQSADLKSKVERVLPVGEPPEGVPAIITIENCASKFPVITGGKGSSLAVLFDIARREKSFVVPKGLVVTTIAFKKFLALPALAKLDEILSCIHGNDESLIKTVCENAVATVQNCVLPETLSTSLLEHLKSVFGKEYENIRFAVRSSACGEDSEEMSTAGQMDTFLGVRGFDEICKAVVKCWSSQFSHAAISYKRRYGQLLNSPMAVVIQEMVPADTAGVMFTCDPVSGNPSTLCITANYGLGESVVSAAAEPDTIMVSRESSSFLKVTSVTKGKKKMKVVMDDGGGTKQVVLTNSNDCCLKEEDSKRLAGIGIIVEKYFGSPRDIEWAFSKDGVYLVQARPVTSLDKETEFEIMHEFDSPFHTEKEFLTTGNTGEVLRGAVSPLGVAVMMSTLGVGMKQMIPKKYYRDENSFSSGYIHESPPVSSSNFFVNLQDLICRFSPNPADPEVNNSLVIGILGRVIDDNEISESAAERREKPPETKMRHIINLLRVLFFTGTWLFIMKSIYWNFQIRFRKSFTALDMYSNFIKNLYVGAKVTAVHIEASIASTMFNNIAMVMISKSRGGSMNADTYTDLAHLLSSCENVISAEVPENMRSLAESVKRDIDKETFKNFTPQEALDFLKATRKPCGKQFKEFIETHGHRCVNEFDVRSVTWDMDPTPVVKNIQAMMVTVRKDSLVVSRPTSWNLVTSLNLPMSFSQKLMLTLCTRWCRQGVGLRENSKSFLIHVMHVYRKSLVILSEKMVSEGRLPDADLMFFLTLEEIELLLSTRDPALVARAHLRRRLYPALRELNFPEIIKCPPVKPVSTKSADISRQEGGVEMRGIPISKGIAKGPVRVALRVEDAHMIKEGDILITHSTDIGWSPYFPLLAGIVTEIGGLMSHGAVVAREFGLPCLVGMKGSTKLFKTGDFVLLDASNGILMQIEDDS